MSKKLEQKQARREAEERKRQEITRAARRRNLITLGVVGLVGALVVALIVMERGANTVSDDFGVAVDEAGCEDVQTHEPEGREHVDDGTDVQYGTVPPTSGNHYARWWDPGFQSEQIPEEHLVHNLEHGQIVIWYSPDAPDEVLSSLETYVDAEGLPMLAAPYDQVPEPATFVVTAWAASQACEEVSGQVLAEFRERYQGKGPEPVGIPTYDGDA